MLYPLTVVGETSKGATLAMEVTEFRDGLTGCRMVRVKASNKANPRRYVYEVDAAIGRVLYKRLAQAAYTKNPRIIASAIGPTWKMLREQSEAGTGNVTRMH